MSCEQAQVDFDNHYIGSVEICQRLNISRVALYQGRARGFLPEHITVNGTNTFLWLRKDAEPMIDQWKARLDQRRGVANA